MYNKLPYVVMSLYIHLLKRGLLVLISFLTSIRHFQHYTPFYLR